jgi:hypothetical protein
MRVFCRREKPHPGAQLSLFEQLDGWRYQLVATNAPGKNAQFLEARHRPHARVEDSILRQANRARSLAVGLDRDQPGLAYGRPTIAAALLCWPRLLCPHGPLAAAEPKTLRYRLLHTAARIVRGERKRKIRIPET